MTKKNSSAEINIIQIWFDFLFIALGYLLTNAFFGAGLSASSHRTAAALCMTFAVIYVLAAKGSRLYDTTLFFYLDRFVAFITRSFLLAGATTTVLMFANDPGEAVRRFYYAYLVLSYLILLISMFFFRLVQFYRKRESVPRTAFVGRFNEYRRLHYFLNKTSLLFNETGYILRDGEQADGTFNALGTLSDLETIIHENELDQIFFLQKSTDDAVAYRPYIDLCTELGVTARVVIEMPEVPGSMRYVSAIGVYPVVTHHTISLNVGEQCMKRLMDIIISLLALIAASPIMLLTMIAIRLESKGPVVFKQERVGQNGRTFHIYKFRSMVVDAEAKLQEIMRMNEMGDARMFKMKDDPRITRVGAFIRKTSIDELPQLANVLKGDMSLVGTRPPTVEETTHYETKQWRRISIKPGITGMWQVNGRSNITDFEKVVELDLHYIDNWSLLLDLKILAKTALVLVNKAGAY